MGKTDRRGFVASLGAVGVSFVGGTAQAALQCSQPVPFNRGLVQTCTAGVRVSVRTTQRCDQWCWAACIEAAFGLAGFELAQERIVERLYGSQFVCAPAVGPGIASAIQGRWTDRRGRSFRGEVRVLRDVDFGVFNPFAIQEASRFLSSGVPLINGALGHATLMTAMTWIQDNFGNQQLQEIIVRDPWPGRPNRRVLTAQELFGTTFLAAVTASRL